MLEKGASTNELTIKKACGHAVIYSFVSLFMRCLGVKWGTFFFQLNDILVSINQFVTVVILFGISLLIMIITFKREKYIEHYDQTFGYMDSLKKSVICGVDVFLAGVSISIFGLSCFNLGITIFIITLLMIMVALYIGYYKGAVYQRLFGIICSLVYFVFANYQLFVLIWGSV